MNTIFIKAIFLIYTLFIFLYSSSYAKFEITQDKNIFGGIFIFIFSLLGVVTSNIVFFTA